MKRNNYFFAEAKYGKNFEKKNEKIALKVLFSTNNRRKISKAYESKHNFKRQHIAILLMITYDKKWHYLAVKNLFIDACHNNPENSSTTKINKYLVIHFS